MSSMPWISSCLNPGRFWNIEFSASQPLHHVEHFYFQKTCEVPWFLCLFYLIYNLSCSETNLTLTSWLFSHECPCEFLRLSSLHRPVNAACWMMSVAHHLHFLTGHAVPYHPGLSLCFLLIPRHRGVGLTKPCQGSYTDQIVSPSQALSLIPCSSFSSLFLSQG